MDELSVRERIIDESTRLFAARGYAGASVREIVEAVGVTKPTLYYHFGSKERLYAAVVEHHMALFNKAGQELLQGPGTVIERLTAIVNMELLGAMAAPDVVRFLMGALQQAGQGAPALDTGRYHRERMDSMTALIAEGVESGELAAHAPKDAALALMGMVNLRVSASVMGSCPMDPDLPDRLIRLFLEGAAS